MPEGRSPADAQAEETPVPSAEAEVSSTDPRLEVMVCAAMADRYTVLHEALAPERAALLAHPVYRLVRDRRGLGVFMGAHVFAVWDFMSLLKSLQRRLTGIEVPWTPPRSRTAARLVNAIVLAEESDEVASGITMSHFELYLEAMRELDVATAPVTSFVRAVAGGTPLAHALAAVPAPVWVKRFVEGTVALAIEGSVEAVAGAFFFGREDLVPEMFRRLLPEVAATREAVSFRRYLERHVEVDEAEHGPAARALLVELCGDDDARWERATRAARAALGARRTLWDGVVTSLRAQREPGAEASARESL